MAHIEFSAYNLYTGLDLRNESTMKQLSMNTAQSISLPVRVFKINRARRISKSLVNLKTQVCIAYDTNNYKRCNQLIARVKILEAYLIRLNTIKFFSKVA